MRRFQIYNIILWGQTSAFSRSGFHRLPSPLMGILVLFGFLCKERTQANKTTFPIHVFLNVHWEEFAPKKHTYAFTFANTEKHKENAVCLLIAFPLSILFKIKNKKSPLKEYLILSEMFCSFLTPGGGGLLSHILCSFSCIQLSQVWTYTKACKTSTTKHPPGVKVWASRYT